MTTRTGARKSGFIRLLWKNGRDILMRGAQIWLDARGPTMGAALAYYMCFSLAPLLILVIAIAGAVFGRAAAEGALLDQFENLMGHTGALAIQGMLRNASDIDKGLVAGLVSITLLAIAATTVLAELRASLNIIWQAPPPKTSTIVEFIRVRLLGLALIGALGFLLLVSLIVSAALTAFNEWLKATVPDLNAVLQFGSLALPFAVMTLLFAVIFQFLPNTRIRWHDVWMGAGITALLFSIGKGAIALYIGQSGVASSFGAAGAIVFLLVWVYYSAQIFLLGAALTRAYAEILGSRRKMPLKT